MAFTFDGKTLYAHKVTLRGGREQTLYFFSAGKPKNGEPCELPAGYEPAKTAKGLPVLRRVAKGAA